MLVGRGKLLVRGRGLLKFWELDYLLRGISSGIQWQGKRRHGGFVLKWGNLQHWMTRCSSCVREN